MALDPSIPLQIKPIQLQDPVEQYARGMTLSNLALQNEQATRQYKMDLDTETAFREAGGDPEKAQQALMQRGLYKPAMALAKQANEQKKADLQAQELQGKVTNQRAGGAVGEILALRDNPSDEAIMESIQRHRDVPQVAQLGQQILSVQDLGARKNMFTQMLMAMPGGREALQAISPKVDYKSAGATLQPVQTNPLAGPVGPAQGMAPIPVTEQPGIVANRTLVPGQGGQYVPNQPLIEAKRQIAAAGAPRLTVQNLSENEYAKKVGGSTAERDIEQHKTAQNAAEGVTKINEVLNHLKSSDAITGMGSEMLLNLKRAQTFLLGQKSAGKEVSDTELLDAMLGSDVFPMIGALGIGARGMDTPAEREFLRKVMTGTISLNKTTLIRMTEIRKNVAERAADRWNKRVESGELDRYFELTHTPKEKVELPKAAPDSITNMKRAVEAAGGTYEPDKYEYRVIDGEVKRRRR